MCLHACSEGFITRRKGVIGVESLGSEPYDIALGVQDTYIVVTILGKSQ